MDMVQVFRAAAIARARAANAATARRTREEREFGRAVFEARKYVLLAGDLADITYIAIGVCRGRSAAPGHRGRSGCLTRAARPPPVQPSPRANALLSGRKRCLPEESDGAHVDLTEIELEKTNEMSLADVGDGMDVDAQRNEREEEALLGAWATGASDGCWTLPR